MSLVLKSFTNFNDKTEIELNALNEKLNEINGLIVKKYPQEEIKNYPSNIISKISYSKTFNCFVIFLKFKEDKKEDLREVPVLVKCFDVI